MPLPAGTKTMVEMLHNVHSFSVTVEITMMIPGYAMGPGYPETFVCNTNVPLDHWHEDVTSLMTQGQYLSGYGGKLFGGLPVLTQGSLEALPVTKDLMARMSQDYDYHLEDDFVTLVPTRAQLAAIITQAEAEFTEGATPAMLADFILLRLSEAPQIIKPISMMMAEQRMKEMAIGDHNLPPFMQQVMHSGQAGEDLLLAGSYAATAYLRYRAEQNIEQIKGNGNGKKITY